MSIKRSLPEVNMSGNPDIDFFDEATYHLREALFYNRKQRGTVGRMNVEFALAYVRVWRKSLPDQGVRRDDPVNPPSDRHLLCWTLISISWAGLEQDTAFHLRSAEAYLRTWLKRNGVR